MAFSGERHSKAQILRVKNIPLNRSRAKGFFQCKDCAEEFKKNNLSEFLSIKEYGMYEASLYCFEYPDGKKADIVVIWCKRCGKPVWDSRGFIKVF